MDTQLFDNLKNLGFSKNEIKVYVALTRLGESRAAQIAKKISLPRTTVISLLQKLEVGGFVSAHKYKKITSYWIESPHVIEEIFRTRVDIAEELGRNLASLYRTEANFPSGAVYDTKKSIRTFIEKIIANSKKGTIFYTIDAPNQGNYRKIYPEVFGSKLIELKDKKGIITKTLIPSGTFGQVKVVKVSNNTFFLREMPKGIDFNASLWIIDNLLVHFSGNPPFAVAIKHPLVVTGMKNLYDFLWNMSEKKYPD